MTDKAETNDMAMPARKRRRAAASRSGPPKFRVPSVEKALDVLELLSDSPQGMTMNEITGALGRTMGELYRIVVYLSQRGYIAQDPDTDRYALTLRLFELSHRHDPTDRLLKRAIPVLETIAFRTEQSCHLAVLHQSAVLVLASVPSPRPAGYSVRTGAVFPVSKTSSGVVILSFLPPDVQERFLSGFAASEQAALRRRMGEIAARGYDQGESSLVHGVNNLSAPVFDRSGVVAAITMGYIAQVDQRCGPRQALDEIVAGANELSAALGGRNPLTMPANANL